MVHMHVTLFDLHLTLQPALSHALAAQRACLHGASDHVRAALKT